jgi:hypothetical protein
MAGYLTKYGTPKLFVFHRFAEKFVGASLQLYNAWTASDLLTYLFGYSKYLSAHTPNTSTISCLLMTYTLSLCLK